MFQFLLGAARAPFQIAGGAFNMARGMYRSPTIWGITAQSGLMKKLAFPAAIAGGFGLVGAGRNLISGGYNMDPAQVAWGHTPGATMTPYTDTPMSFRRNFSDMNANGSLALSLWNQRKA